MIADILFLIPNSKFKDGKLLSLDWAPTRSLDTGKLETPKAEVISERFSGETILLQESPFLRGCYLFVTKWNFSLWYDDYKVIFAYRLDKNKNLQNLN